MPYYMSSNSDLKSMLDNTLADIIITIELLRHYSHIPDLSELKV